MPGLSNYCWRFVLEMCSILSPLCCCIPSRRIKGRSAKIKSKSTLIIYPLVLAWHKSDLLNVWIYLGFNVRSKSSNTLEKYSNILEDHSSRETTRSTLIRKPSSMLWSNSVLEIKIVERIQVFVSPDLAMIQPSQVISIIFSRGSQP